MSSKQAIYKQKPYINALKTSILLIRAEGAKNFGGEKNRERGAQGGLLNRPKKGGPGLRGAC